MQLFNFADLRQFLDINFFIFVFLYSEKKNWLNHIGHGFLNHSTKNCIFGLVVFKWSIPSLRDSPPLTSPLVSMLKSFFDHPIIEFFSRRLGRQHKVKLRGRAYQKIFWSKPSKNFPKTSNSIFLNLLEKWSKSCSEKISPPLLTALFLPTN